MDMELLFEMMKRSEVESGGSHTTLCVYSVLLNHRLQMLTQQILLFRGIQMYVHTHIIQHRIIMLSLNKTHDNKHW